MSRERLQPILEGLVRIDDNFQLPVGQSSDGARALWGQGNFDPFPVQSKRIGNPEDLGNMFERHSGQRHTYTMTGILDFRGRAVNEEMPDSRETSETGGKSATSQIREGDTSDSSRFSRKSRSHTI